MAFSNINCRPIALSFTAKLLLALMATYLGFYSLSTLTSNESTRHILMNLSQKIDENKNPFSCPVPPLLTADQFRKYLSTPQTKCENKTIWGGRPKGNRGSEKRVCFDERFKIRPGSCVVFSFGINHDFSFEDEFANYGCQVYAYDPTMDIENHERSPRLHFIATGIANFQGTKLIGMGKNWKERKVDRFENLVKAAGMEGKVIDMVKLDVELSEIDFLQDMLFNSFHLLKNIKQIAMEIHAEMRSNTVSPTSRFQLFWPYLHLMRCAGFELISTVSGGKWREVVWAQEKEW